MSEQKSAAHLIPDVIIQGLSIYLGAEDVYSLLIACLTHRDFELLRRKFLLMPGILDVLPFNHPKHQPVLTNRIKYQGKSSLLMAATQAHMTLMTDLMRRCEYDRVIQTDMIVQCLNYL